MEAVTRATMVRKQVDMNIHVLSVSYNYCHQYLHSEALNSRPASSIMTWSRILWILCLLQSVPSQWSIKLYYQPHSLSKFTAIRVKDMIHDQPHPIWHGLLFINVVYPMFTAISVITVRHQTQDKPHPLWHDWHCLWLKSSAYISYTNGTRHWCQHSEAPRLMTRWIHYS